MSHWLHQSLQATVGTRRLESSLPDAGPPILFLHGVTRLGRDWAPVFPSLSSHWQINLLDFRGHGQSTRTPGEYLVRHYVDDAVLAAEAIGKPLVVVGHSLGAMVGLALAHSKPNLIRAIVLEDPPFDTLGPRILPSVFHSQFTTTLNHLRARSWTSTTQLAHQLADFIIEDPIKQTRFRMGDVRDTVALRFHAACLSHMDPAAFEPIVEGRWLEGFNWKSIIPDVRCPILLLQADTAAGGMLTNDDAHFLIDHATDLTAVRFPDISHQIHGTDTAAFLKFVIPFLESVRICMIS